MGKFFTMLAVLFLAGGSVFVFMRVTSVEDSWIQDKETGAWIRHGNPSGPAPQTAASDCWARAGRAYAQAVGLCIPQLCAADEVCINDLLDVFDAFRNRQSPDAVLKQAPAPAAEIPAPAASAPASSTEATGGMGGSEESEAAPASVMSAENKSLRLWAPAPGAAALTSPFQVRGEVHEDVESLIVRVKGSNGVILIEEVLTPYTPAEEGWRSFKITLAYDFDTTNTGSVEVLPQGGEPVSVPVEFR